MSELLVRIEKLPPRFRKITLPGDVRRAVGYKYFIANSAKMTVEEEVANYLTNNPKYKPYFDIKLPAPTPKKETDTNNEETPKKRTSKRTKKSD